MRIMPRPNTPREGGTQPILKAVGVWPCAQSRRGVRHRRLPPPARRRAGSDWNPPQRSKPSGVEGGMMRRKPVDSVREL